MKTNDIKTVSDLLEYLEENYNTKECSPSAFTKTIIINNIIAKVGLNPLLSNTLRAKCLQSNTVNEFIQAIKNNTKTDTKLTYVNVTKLESDIKNIVLIAGLKELKKVEAQQKKKKQKIKILSYGN